METGISITLDCKQRYGVLYYFKLWVIVSFEMILTE